MTSTARDDQFNSDPDSVMTFDPMHEQKDGGIWPNIWIMRTAEGFYPIEPSAKCKPEDHGNLNPHVVSIENMRGDVLWAREASQ